MLRDRGQEATEVREVLAQDASDDAVTAYAASQGLVLITHDRGCARANASGVPHLWLRTPETGDLERLRDVLLEVQSRLEAGATRLTLFPRVLRIE